MATREARLAAEEPRCQALDWTSVQFVASPFPGICPGFAAACVPFCRDGLRIRLLLVSVDVQSLFPFCIILDYEECAFMTHSSLGACSDVVLLLLK